MVVEAEGVDVAGLGEEERVVRAGEGGAHADAQLVVERGALGVEVGAVAEVLGARAAEVGAGLGGDLLPDRPPEVLVERAADARLRAAGAAPLGHREAKGRVRRQLLLLDVACRRRSER